MDRANQDPRVKSPSLTKRKRSNIHETRSRASLRSHKPHLAVEDGERAKALALVS